MSKVDGMGERVLRKGVKLPRNVGYSRENALLYNGKGEESLIKAKNSMFSQCLQKDLFIFAFALGLRYGERKRVNKKVSYVSVEAMTEAQRWLIYASRIAESEDVKCLDDVVGLFKVAEEYANSGIEILKERFYDEGANYADELEIELKRIMGLC